MVRTPLFLCPIMLLCFVTTLHAANITAASCSSSDVQAAINSAAMHDTVKVPPGNCTWTSTVTVASKGITLTGAGIGQTNITDQGSDGAALLVTGASAINFVNISGFTFIKSTAHAGGMVQIIGDMFTQAFRFHHNRLLQASFGSRGMTVVAVYGLIDHNLIDVTSPTGSIQSVSIFGSSNSNDGGFTPWKQPLTLGTNKAVYIEDNVITYNVLDTGKESGFDAYSGARYVIRYNQANNVEFGGHHGTDSGGMRSPVSFEVYNNTYVNNSTTVIRAGTIRGGTGVIFNNTYGGTVSAWHAVHLLYYRACYSPSLVFGWGRCDGTNWELMSDNLSSDNSRRCSETGGFRFDNVTNEIVATEGRTYTNYFDGGGAGGYPCRDQPGRGPGQVLEPIYFWNNTGATIVADDFSDPNNCNGYGIDNYIRSGRDFIDNGSTPKPGYTPYTYPHPLQAIQSNRVMPIPPGGLFVK